MAQIGKVGGLLTTIGLLGWAFGGFFFGIVADYLGRVRTLALSILIYSVFTALQGFSHEVWQLGLFRFIAGLGSPGRSMRRRETAWQARLADSASAGSLHRRRVTARAAAGRTAVPPCN
jgi:MFS family permease